jgi:hypothetical protein
MATHLTRKELEDNAKRESELADLKQHADKLILGFANSSSIETLIKESILGQIIPKEILFQFH